MSGYDPDDWKGNDPKDPKDGWWLTFACVLIGLFFFYCAFFAPAAHAECYGTCSTEAQKREARHAIRVVFKGYADQALRVSWCESHHDVHARNGQYRGIFQMGSSERRTYGHGSGAWAQAIAAHRYFVASGRDWSPWSCKP